MSKSKIPDALRRIIIEQFEPHCVYCQSDRDTMGTIFTIDHIIPESEGGKTERGNLCFSCWDCNRIKSNKLGGVDPISQKFTDLFHPQRQNWSEHFHWSSDGLRIVGKTATGRVTIEALQLNREGLSNARARWVDSGWHPPK